MWETRLHITYNDYGLKCDQTTLLMELVSLSYENLKPETFMEIPEKQQQHQCGK